MSPLRLFKNTRISCSSKIAGASLPSTAQQWQDALTSSRCYWIIALRWMAPVAAGNWEKQSLKECIRLKGKTCHYLMKLLVPWYASVIGYAQPLLISFDIHGQVGKSIHKIPFIVMLLRISQQLVHKESWQQHLPKYATIKTQVFPSYLSHSFSPSSVFVFIIPVKQPRIHFGFFFQANGAALRSPRRP